MVGISVGLDDTTDRSSCSGDDMIHRSQQQRTRPPRDRPRGNQNDDATMTTSSFSEKIIVGNCIISTCNAMGAYVASCGGTMMWVARNSSAGNGNDNDDNGDNIEDTSSTFKVHQQNLAPLLASVAFGVLALQEIYSFWKQNLSPESTAKDRHVAVGEETGSFHNMTRAVQLAIPMTLNNLAGGVAGGAVGVTPIRAFVCGWTASFGAMMAGYWIGSRRWSSSLHRLNKQPASPTTHNKSTSIAKRMWATIMDPSLISAALFGALSILSLLEIEFA